MVAEVPRAPHETTIRALQDQGDGGTPVTGKSVRVNPVATTEQSGGTPIAAWERLRLALSRYRYPLLMIGAIAVVAAGQLVEDAADGTLQMLTPTQSIRRYTLIALVLYELVMAAIVYWTVSRSSESLRRVMKLDEASFVAYEQRFRLRDWSTDLVLLVISMVIVAFLFIGVGLDLLDDDPLRQQSLALPSAPLSAAIVLAGYTVIGWAGLKLIYVAARMGRLLGRLSREPLQINVFDTTALLPFGNIALAVALAPAGIIAILLVGLGAPSSLLGWTILLLASLASLLALLLPLRGVHRQMSDAKDAALETINVRISRLFSEVSSTTELDKATMARFSDSSGALIPLRKAIEEMTTWPFRDTLAFGRAVLIALAPLIYTTLSELIRVFWISPLSR